ncbi:MAG: homospermidine synthase [Gammaproteobacteria bacterium]|nr:homospermidine synthase [Gammaproteobacteria bacterium]
MMNLDPPLPFGGRLLMVGFGCIGQGVLPLLMRHIALKPGQVRILRGDGDGRAIADAHGVSLAVCALDPDNFRQRLAAELKAGDFLLNLSVDVSSRELIAWCQERGVLYLDTCIEPWAGGYVDRRLSLAQRTNYALREAVLDLRRRRRGETTAIVTHGANPGIISHLTKQALLNIAGDLGRRGPLPSTREAWARLAQDLGIRVIHVAERDTQLPALRKQPGEFLNTWSVDGFIDEGCQPAELGWGSHERRFPEDGRRHESGCGSAIYLTRPGAGTRVRTWTPLAGPCIGFLITHGESISISDYLTLGDPLRPDYRPTVHYAYYPCDDAVLSLHELAGRNWQPQARRRVLKDELLSGVDELGVLLMGHGRGAYWFGSRLSVGDARALCPYNSATSLQVTASVLAGVLWAMAHPMAGILEPDELPYDELLCLCGPYLGELVGEYSDWTPLTGRESLFGEELDRTDPWQFTNFRVL